MENFFLKLWLDNKMVPKREKVTKSELWSFLVLTFPSFFPFVFFLFFFLCLGYIPKKGWSINDRDDHPVLRISGVSKHVIFSRKYSFTTSSSWIQYSLTSVARFHCAALSLYKPFTFVVIHENPSFTTKRKKIIQLFKKINEITPYKIW